MNIELERSITIGTQTSRRDVTADFPLARREPGPSQDSIYTLARFTLRHGRDLTPPVTEYQQFVDEYNTYTDDPFPAPAGAAIGKVISHSFELGGLYIASRVAFLGELAMVMPPEEQGAQLLGVAQVDADPADGGKSEAQLRYRFLTGGVASCSGDIRYDRPAPLPELYRPAHLISGMFADLNFGAILPTLLGSPDMAMSFCHLPIGHEQIDRVYKSPYVGLRGPE